MSGALGSNTELGIRRPTSGSWPIHSLGLVYFISLKKFFYFILEYS